MSKKISIMTTVLAWSLFAGPLTAQEATTPSNSPAEQDLLRVVSLLDVAEIEFEPNPERLEDWGQWPASWAHDFFLVVDQSGTPTLCEPFDLSKESELSRRLCDDLLANAKARILRGFTLGGRQGILLLSKQPFVTLPGIASDETRSVPLFSVELAPEAFTDYAPITAAESVYTPGIIPLEPDVPLSYPNGSAADSQKGTSGLVLLISSDGKVMTCRPVESSGYARFDNASCRYAIEHLTFDVSAVPEGHFAPFYFPQKITYRISN